MSLIGHNESGQWRKRSRKKITCRLMLWSSFKMLNPCYPYREAFWSEMNVTPRVTGEEIGTFFYSQCSRHTSPLIPQWISQRKVRTFTRKVFSGSKSHGKFWSHGLFIGDFPQFWGKPRGKALREKVLLLSSFPQISQFYIFLWATAHRERWAWGTMK